eukprot:m.161663 g.161663  ORF g.161663 m.161663 type:complete len:375 (+) comp15198_c4_seq1:4111-5235(+)
MGCCERCFLCPRIDKFIEIASKSPQRQFEDEFGLRSTPAKGVSIEREDTNRCFHVSSSIILLLAGCLAALVLCRAYLGAFLSWLADLPGPHGAFLFVVLFTVVSFPMMWGYIILNLGAGYIYGLVAGTLITSIGANIGALVSFLVCRQMWREWVLQKLSSYENMRQIVRVIEGRQGFRIIAMTRLTPVPFGLQNALFSTANISKTRYITATFIGLLPTQLLNTYMGTTLRSMEDVLSGKNSNTIVLIAQVLITLAVTYLINVRMKHEVHTACEQEVRAREQAESSALHRAVSMQSMPVSIVVPEDLPSPSRSHSVVDLEELDSEPIAPLQSLAAPTTAGGQFVRGHRRTQSAGPVLKSKELIIKLGASVFRQSK